jgi:hypothetical protein
MMLAATMSSSVDHQNDNQNEDHHDDRNDRNFVSRHFSKSENFLKEEGISDFFGVEIFSGLATFWSS